jgi:hypothetical protein
MTEEGYKSSDVPVKKGKQEKESIEDQDSTRPVEEYAPPSKKKGGSRKKKVTAEQ